MNDLKLIMLGTGGAFTRFEHNYHNNALVETEEGWVLIDCGATAVQSMHEIGIKPWDVAAVLVTHVHGDHVNGIEQLAYERFYTGERGPNWAKTLLLTPPSVAPGLVQTLTPGVAELVTPKGATNHGFETLFDVGTHAPEGWFFGGVRFMFHETPHIEGAGVSKPSFGVEIRRGDAQLCYTSDTTFLPDIGSRAHARGLVLHDCTFSPRYAGTVHTHYSELLTLPPEVRERVLLMHHGRVPEGISVEENGFRGALRRHEQVLVSQKNLVSTSLRSKS